MLTTDQKGAIAESAIVHAALKLGIGVYKPVAEGGRFDLVFDVGRLLRVQCKWSPCLAETICVRCYSTRRTAVGLARRRYELQEIDAIAAYCPDNGRCYLLPASMTAGRTEVRLRLAPARNNQRAGVHWASDYQLESLDWDGITGP